MQTCVRASVSYEVHHSCACLSRLCVEVSGVKISRKSLYKIRGQYPLFVKQASSKMGLGEQVL